MDWRSRAVLLASAGLCVATGLFWVQRLWGPAARVGDGRQVESYGFDLSTCRVPREQLVAAGFAKDGIPALRSPEVLTGAQLDVFARELRAAHRGKYLVEHDRVVGVECGGEARAYPLRILAWHEVVNDTLGGRPIVVTYNPLCDSVVIFDRRVGDETLEFGVSGLLYNSNLVMYDRRVGGGGRESLWCQLQFRAIAGPAAEEDRRLELVPMAVMPWGDWRAGHAATTVLAPDRGRWRVYENTYDAYFRSDRVRFPVQPLPPDGPAFKTPMIAVRTTGAWQVFCVSDIVSWAGAAGTWEAAVDGVSVRFGCRADPLTAWVQDRSGAPVESVNAFWFAWYAMRAGR